MTAPVDGYGPWSVLDYACRHGERVADCHCPEDARVPVTLHRLPTTPARTTSDG